VRKRRSAWNSAPVERSFVFRHEWHRLAAAGLAMARGDIRYQRTVNSRNPGWGVVPAKTTLKV
jgi:hypothetical protein